MALPVGFWNSARSSSWGHARIGLTTQQRGARCGQRCRAGRRGPARERTGRRAHRRRRPGHLRDAVGRAGGTGVPGAGVPARARRARAARERADGRGDPGHHAAGHVGAGCAAGDQDLLPRHRGHRHHRARLAADGDPGDRRLRVRLSRQARRGGAPAFGAPAGDRAGAAHAGAAGIQPDAGGGRGGGAAGHLGGERGRDGADVESGGGAHLRVAAGRGDRAAAARGAAGRGRRVTGAAGAAAARARRWWRWSCSASGRTAHRWSSACRRRRCATSAAGSSGWWRWRRTSPSASSSRSSCGRRRRWRPSGGWRAGSPTTSTTC